MQSYGSATQPLDCRLMIRKHRSQGGWPTDRANKAPRRFKPAQCGDLRVRPLLADIVAKLFSRLPTRNIDSRTSQSAQYRIRDAGFSDSIIARWQRSKEFCNKIGPHRRFRNVCFSAALEGIAEVPRDRKSDVHDPTAD